MSLKGEKKKLIRWILLGALALAIAVSAIFLGRPGFPLSKYIFIYAKNKTYYEAFNPADAEFSEGEDQKRTVVYSIDKYTFSNLTDADIRLLYNNMKYIYSNDYSKMLVDFLDGTCIEIHLKEPEFGIGEYGTWDNIENRISDSKCTVVIDETGIAFSANGVETGFSDLIYGGNRQKNLSEIQEISEYLIQLNELIATDKSAAVFISVKDECTNKITPELASLLYRLGGTVDLSDPQYYRNSYAFVIDPLGETREDVSPSSSICISGKLTDSDINYSVISSGHDSGSMSSILVDGEECSLNRRGINVVVYNKTQRYVIDTVSFDTYSNYSANR